MYTAPGVATAIVAVKPPAQPEIVPFRLAKMNLEEVLATPGVNWNDAVLVLLNRDAGDRTVTNGLAFAGLPAGSYRDVLTGDVFTSAGDSLTITVPALGSRVLVPE